MGKKTVLYFLIFCVVLCSTWQDFFLANIFGEIFRTPMLLFLPFMIVSEYKLSNIPKTKNFKIINDFFLKTHIFFLLTTLIIIVYWGFNDGRLYLLGENILVKCVKALSYFTLLWLVFRFFYYLLLKASKYNLKVEMVFFWLTIFYLIILLLEVLTLPNALFFLHSNSEPYTRIRLLTAESSWTGGIALLLTMGLFYNRPSKVKYWTSGLFILIFTITSGSKQFLLGLLLSFLIIFVKGLKKNFFSIFILGAAFFGFFYLFIFPYLLSSVTQDLESYTSAATRSISFITSLKFIYNYPIGTGGMYFYYFNLEVKNSAVAMSRILPDLNFSEVLDWGANGSSKAVSPKSTFSYMVVVLGIPGVYLLAKLYRGIYNMAKGNILMLVLVIYFIITSIFLEPIEGKPNISIFLALLCFSADFLQEKK